MEPAIEMVRNDGLTAKDIRVIELLIEEHEDEIRSAWHGHFEA